MALTPEQIRKKSEARRQRILASQSKRLDTVSKGMASKPVSKPLSFTSTTADNSAKKSGGEKLRLTLRANRLTNVAGAFKGTSDPYAEVQITAGSNGRELLKGDTCVIKNSLNPAWTDTFTFDYTPEGKIKVSITDEVRKSDDIPMGSAEFNIADILQSSGSIKEEDLTYDNNMRGKVWARLTKVPPRSYGQLNLILEVNDLKKSGTDRSDPFFEIRRTYDGEECDGKVGERQWPIYRSEYVKDKRSHKFERATIDINDLCGGDLNRTIQVIVFDHEKKGGHELIGSFDTTVNKLVAGKTFEMKKDSKVCGSVNVDGCKIVGADPTPKSEPVPTPKPKPVDPTPEPKPVDPIPKPVDPTPEPKPVEPTPKPKPVNPTPNPAPTSPYNKKDGGSIASSTNDSSSTKRSEYISFLSNYEEMVRRQDFEYDYTTKYLKSVFDRVQHLGRTSSNRSAPQDRGGDLLTYRQMRRCLLRIGESWDNSLPPLFDDDISVNSFDSTSGGRDDIALDTELDRQLVMLLTTLVEAEERYRADKLANDEEDEIEIPGVCFLEFVQAYQIVVASMQTLQMLNDDGKVKKAQIKELIGNRVRDRTFGLIRPFGPDLALCKEGDENGSNSGLRPSSGRIKISDKKPKATDDGRCLNEDELGKLLREKDEKIDLVKKLHKEEFDVATDRFQTLKNDYEEVCNRLEWKIKFLIIVTVIITVVFLEVMVTRVHKRQMDVTNGIAALREEDNKLNAKLVTKLSVNRDALQNKVGDTEGTMRYLMSRNEGIDVSNEELEAEMKRIAEKYFVDEAEFMRCEVEEKELKEALTNESALLKEMEKELGWCQKRKNLPPQLADKPVRRALIVQQVCSAAVGFVVSSMLHKVLSGMFLKPVIGPLPPPPPPPPPPSPPKNALLKKILDRLKTHRFFIWKRNERAELAVIDGFFDGWIAYYIVSAIAVLVLP